MKNKFRPTLTSKLITSFLGMFLFFSTITNSHAKHEKNMIIETILTLTEQAFDDVERKLINEIKKENITEEQRLIVKEETDKEKLSIISTPISSKYHRGKKDIPNDFYQLENDKFNVNPLILSIAHGDLRRTKKFLKVMIPIKSEKFWNAGFDENNTLAHAALNPAHFGCYNWDHFQRYSIIELLAQKNINFNKAVPMLKEQFMYINDKDLPQYPVIERKKLLLIALLNGANAEMEYRFFSEEDFTNPDSEYFKTIFACGLYRGFNKLNEETLKLIQIGYEASSDVLKNEWGENPFKSRSRL
ncbi:MAG: hypothetical protein Q8L85_06785 [Alphaproteobacteria bacterium]|nr:hypothetical protein [Alphaproteobacteria bacterium]